MILQYHNTNPGTFKDRPKTNQFRESKIYIKLINFFEIANQKKKKFKMVDLSKNQLKLTLEQYQPGSCFKYTVTLYIKWQNIWLVEKPKCKIFLRNHTKQQILEHNQSEWKIVNKSKVLKIEYAKYQNSIFCNF